MARTTLDIANPVLRDLKRLQAREAKSLGQLASELLAEALAARGDRPRRRTEHRWNVSAGRLLVDLDDKEALAGVLDRDSRTDLRK